jgi:hypothetical protein
MQDRKQKKSRRKGVWEQIEVLEDPDSHVGLVLSERIRGKFGHSIQIIHTDDMGLNKHIPIPPDGAKHDLKDIVYSLVARAEELVAKRTAEWEKRKGKKDA